MHIIVMQGSEVIVDLPGWEEAIPPVGAHIFMPPDNPGDPPGFAGPVKAQGWFLYDRGPDGGFVAAANPYVEIHI